MLILMILKDNLDFFNFYFQKSRFASFNFDKPKENSKHRDQDKYVEL